MPVDHCTKYMYNSIKKKSAVPSRSYQDQIQYLHGEGSGGGGGGGGKGGIREG